MQQAGTRNLLPVLPWLPVQHFNLPAHVPAQHRLRACVQTCVMQTSQQEHAHKAGNDASSHSPLR